MKRTIAEKGADPYFPTLVLLHCGFLGTDKSKRDRGNVFRYGIILHALAVGSIDDHNYVWLMKRQEHHVQFMKINQTAKILFEMVNRSIRDRYSDRI